MLEHLNVLLVEDEPGIREGLASFLKFKGLRVTTAASCAEGIAALAQDDFDVVVTDWRLGDGLGADILERRRGPTIVASGVPEEIVVEPGRQGDVCVIRKPVMPADLVEKIRALAPLPAARPMEPDPVSRNDALPADARDRVALLQAIAGPGEVRLLDDGNIVTVVVELPARGCERVEASRSELERICGDLRILGGGDGEGARLEARFFRDGREDTDTTIVGPRDEWPGAARLAVDFDRSDCSLAAFRELVDRRRECVRQGRHVAFLNVPGHLRLYLEVLGNAHDMPKRGMVGPRIPQVLAELWSACARGPGEGVRRRDRGGGE